MSQLTVKLSDRADALIAQLQKEIFNRRRKKVSAAGVVETLVESGARSQSDKRFATSWTNLIADIEKAAKLADAHGAKPASLSDEEWAMVLNHRTRAPRAAAIAAKRPARKSSARRSAAVTTAEAAAKNQAAPKAKAAVKDTAVAKPRAANATAPAKPRAAAKAPARKAATSTRVSTKQTGSSVARRMAKAVNRLSGATTPLATTTSGNGNGVVRQPVVV